MADLRRPRRRAKKLYIETVGCQMNVLDSELVVAKLRSEGYELTDDIDQADAILYNTCSVRQHAEDKIYSALGRIKRLKERKPEVDDRRPRLHGAEGPGADPPPGAARRRRRRPGPARAGCRSCSRRPSDEDAPQMAVSLARNGGSREVDHGELRELRPDREPAMRPSPFQAFVRIMMGCDKFCTYCIVPSVRGPEQSRPARRDRRRGAAARRPGGQGDHPPGPDRQQLQVPRARRPDRPALRPARAAPRHRRRSSGSSSSPTSPTT